MLKKWLKKIPFPLSKNHRYDLQAQKVIQRVLRSDSRAVDIGSHEGEFLDLFLKYAPAGQHLAFEPLPDFYQNLQEKYGKKCQVYNIALSNQAGSSSFNYVISNPAYSGLIRRKYDHPNEKDTTITVKTECLDQFWEAQHPVRLIKIDVEGAEYQVLEGGQHLLKKDQPFIIFEHGLGAADQYRTTPEMMYDLLKSCGYQVSTMGRWLNGQPELSRTAFARHFYQQLDYYFMAMPISSGQTPTNRH